VIYIMAKSKKKKNKLKSLKRLFFIIILIFIAGIYFKIDSIMGDKLDKSDLAINSNLYKELNISQGEINNVNNILVLGSDTKDIENDTNSRADTIMIISINNNLNSIKFISIPRDTYVSIPDYGMDKLNHAYAYGKEQLIIKTINHSEYITVNFLGLINIINEINGIELEITKEEYKYINENLYEAHEVSGTKIKKLSNYGNVTLTGEQALIYSRNRSTTGSDFERGERQRLVLEALFNKMSSFNIIDTIKLINSFIKQVKTNINLSEYFLKLPRFFFYKNDYLDNIITKQIPALNYSEDKIINNIYYFVADIEKASKDLKEYLYLK